ncbi:MAG: poly-beta-1,6-N-acetyl-D-glucosamine biosynthesis protein PgaD [Thermodesulfobacteriota bacterium]
MADIEIIDKPGLKSTVRKLSEMSVTSFIWLLWLYLFLPIVNILLWIVGVSTFYQELIVKTGYLHFLGLLNKMGLTVLVVFIIMRAWGYYNYRRFGKRNKRKSVPNVTPEELSEIFGLTPEEIVALRTRQEISFSVNKGRIVLHESG